MILLDLDEARQGKAFLSGREDTLLPLLEHLHLQYNTQSYQYTPIG